jgi:protein phosphatase 1 regulatory subunit 11
MPAAQVNGGQTQLQSSAPSTTITRAPQQAVLRLRGAATEDGQGDGEGSERRRIQWAEDVVDNEGMGKKKSKGGSLSHHFLMSWLEPCTHDA